ncbi:uncharacterized protein N7459_005185 [Penicillium hispanicum]|uniref:uncharacterized protein n=1 Tax=Penicillium hispanicum TaxID=1080232 RepID=UPI0025416E90|nr:uncharacterized protein N7459_005185 [Penicillium hispanicum]KAJ5585385.1 hypothetical protein N7459_005185 [Penicillium hispanicum]
MPTPQLQPPDHPIALHRSHLLAPAPDRLTNTPTTLSIVRENTLSGRDFSVYHLRRDEPPASPRRRPLLYTVTGRFWSNSLHREIRDAAGRPLLDLRRIWWRGQWTLKRAGGAGDELLSAELKWGIGVKLSVRFENALVAAQWGGHGPGHGQTLFGRRFSSGDRNRNQNPPAAPAVNPSPHPNSNSNSNSNPTGRQSYDRPPRSRRGAPPPYSAVVGDAQDNAHGGEDAVSDADEMSISLKSCVLPSYASVRRCSTHSLRDLLDAIEPPGEPAPAAASSFSLPRPRSEGAINSRVELKVVQQSGTLASVTLGQRRIIHIQREKVVDFNLSGPMPKWEVDIAEGVDLLLAVSIVLILAESVRHEYRLRVN